MLFLNRIDIIGRAVKDAEVKKVGDSTVASFRLVNNRLIKKKNSNEKEERATYVDCEAWAQRADYAAERVKKGSVVYITGRLESDEWTDKKTGEKRSRLKIYVDNLQVDSKAGGDSSAAKKPRKSEEDDSGDDAPVAVGEASDLPF